MFTVFVFIFLIVIAQLMQIKRLVDLNNRGVEEKIRNFNYQLFELGVKCAFLEQVSGNFSSFCVI